VKIPIKIHLEELQLLEVHQRVVDCLGRVVRQVVGLVVLQLPQLNHLAASLVAQQVGLGPKALDSVVSQPLPKVQVLGQLQLLDHLQHLGLLQRLGLSQRLDHLQPLEDPPLEPLVVEPLSGLLDLVVRALLGQAPQDQGQHSGQWEVELQREASALWGLLRVKDSAQGCPNKTNLKDNHSALGGDMFLVFSQD